MFSLYVRPPLAAIREMTSCSTTCWIRSNVSMISQILMILPSRSVKKIGNVKLHDPLVAPLGEISAKMDRDLVVLGGDERHLVAHAGIALVNRLPHLPDVVLAAVMAEMRENIDRRVREKLDIVAAKRQRPLDVAGIKSLDQLEDASFVEVL